VWRGSASPAWADGASGGGRRIATQTLKKNKPGRLFTVEYPVPRKLTEGKKAVVIRFEVSGKGTVAGGVFGLAVLRKE